MGWGVVSISHFAMYQSIPAAPSTPLSPGSPPGISLFFALDGKFPGWGRKKRANVLSSVNPATFFIDGTVESCHFRHFNVRFLFQLKLINYSN